MYFQRKVINSLIVLLNSNCVFPQSKNATEQFKLKMALLRNTIKTNWGCQSFYTDNRNACRNLHTITPSAALLSVLRKFMVKFHSLPFYYLPNICSVPVLGAVVQTKKDIISLFNVFAIYFAVSRGFKLKFRYMLINFEEILRNVIWNI